MKNPMKAALLSALVYPGAGQFFLKKYLRAVVIAGVFTVPLIYFINNTVDKVQFLLDKVKAGELALTTQAFAAVLAERPVTLDPFWTSMISYTLLLCWLVAIFDAYRLALHVPLTKHKQGA
jgi:hypothetical protein